MSKNTEVAKPDETLVASYKEQAIEAYLDARKHFGDDDLVVIITDEAREKDCVAHRRSSLLGPGCPPFLRQKIQDAPRSFKRMGPGQGFWLVVFRDERSFIIPCVLVQPGDWQVAALGGG